MSTDQTPLKETSLLNEWSIDQNFPDEIRFIDLYINLKYTDIDSLTEFEPKVRKRLIAEDHRKKFKALIQIKLFHEYELIGTVYRPQGVKTRIPFSALLEIEKLDFVGGIFIEKIDGAKRKRQRTQPVFYCVKMTVIAQIEGLENGLQKIEDRFVVIKAKSEEDAYNRLKKQKDEMQYLNSDGRFVRWKIESFDDCYQTDIKSFKDLNNPNGAEVYSKYRSRHSTHGSVSNGK